MQEIRLCCVLNTALDLVQLCAMYAEGQEAKRGQCSVTWVTRSGGIRLGVVFRKEPKRYVGSWVEGFG